jgi:hypothetical protein
MGVESPAVTTFDISAYSSYKRRFDRPTRLVSIAIGLGTIVEWLVLLPSGVHALESRLASGSLLEGAVVVAVLAAGPCVAAFCAYMALVRLSEGPTAVQIDKRGVEFSFSGRPSITLRWDDPRLDLVIRDDLASSRVSPLLAVDVKLRGRAPVPIPPEAYFRILSEAASLGLSIDQSARGDAFDRARGTKVVRIRVQAKTGGVVQAGSREHQPDPGGQ